MWKLNEAINYIQNLNPRIQELGYHPALMGSVLTKGMSDNDLDIGIIPYDDKNIKAERGRLLNLLAGLGAREASHEEKEEYSTVYKDIWKLESNGKKIDFFIFDGLYK